MVLIYMTFHRPLVLATSEMNLVYKQLGISQVVKFCMRRLVCPCGAASIRELNLICM
jgi:hypothetical protein